MIEGQCPLVGPFLKQLLQVGQFYQQSLYSVMPFIRVVRQCSAPPTAKLRKHVEMIRCRLAQGIPEEMARYVPLTLLFVTNPPKYVSPC